MPVAVSSAGCADNGIQIGCNICHLPHPVNLSVSDKSRPARRVIFLLIGGLCHLVSAAIIGLACMFHLCLDLRFGGSSCSPSLFRSRELNARGTGLWNFSIFMMPLHYPTENPSLAFDRDIDLIRYAEELGFDEFFIGEHHSGGSETVPARRWRWPKPRRGRIAFDSALPSSACRFTILSHVAERMAFLDHLTHGRAILGVGPCALVTDKNLFGLATEKLYPMMAESVDIIVRLLESPERTSIPTGNSGKLNKCACNCAPTSSRACHLPSRHREIGSASNLPGKCGILYCRRMERGLPEQSVQSRAVEGGRSDGRKARRANFSRQLAHRYLRVPRREPGKSVARR